MNSAADISLDEPVSITTDTGERYQATVEEGVVVISYEDHERWLFSGKGTWDGSAIADCNADLGDDGYELLNDAISNAIST